MMGNWRIPTISDVLDDCTKRGVAIDLNRVSETKTVLQAEQGSMRAQIIDICGEEFSIENQWQLGVVLFEKLGLRPMCRRESGYEVDNGYLAEIDHPVIQSILDYRSAATSLRCIKEYERTARNGRVHPAFTISDIGRICTGNPNVQAMPKPIRSIVVPDQWCTFVKADWRAMHLRLLARLSQDPALIGLFADGRDPFVDLAAMLFGHDVSEVTAAERSTAKSITYALLYGGRCRSLARRHRLAAEVVQGYREAFLGRFRGVHRWINRAVKAARRDGFISTITSRQLSAVGSSAESLDEGTVISRILQGSEADLLTEALIKVDSSFRGGGSMICIPIHDEILVQSYAGWVEDAMELLTYHMTSVGHDLAVPMSVKVMTGPDWGDLREPSANEACA